MAPSIPKPPGKNKAKTALTCVRALEIFVKIKAHDLSDIEAHELDQLVKVGFLYRAEQRVLQRVEVYQDLSNRYKLENPEGLKAVVEELNGKLRSDMHRMTSFAETLRKEEKDRASARRLIGVLGNPDELAQLDEIRRELREAGSPRAFVPLVGTTLAYAVTPLGLRGAMGLTVRLDRFGSVPVGQFCLRFKKADDAIIALAQRVKQLQLRMPIAASQKGWAAVISGLAKSAEDPEILSARYTEAKQAIRIADNAAEASHLAAACARHSTQQPDMATNAKKLASAYNMLSQQLKLPAGPILRGVAKGLLGEADLRAAGTRVAELYNAFRGRTTWVAERRMKVTGRLLSAAGTPVQIVDRYLAANEALKATQPWFGTEDLAVTLAGLCQAQEDVGGIASRLVEIIIELKRHHALDQTVPMSTASLSACPGTPQEVVDVLRQVMMHFSSGALPPLWANSPWWDLACGVTRRFAY